MRERDLRKSVFQPYFDEDGEVHCSTGLLACTVMQRLLILSQEGTIQRPTLSIAFKFFCKLD